MMIEHAPGPGIAALAAGLLSVLCGSAVLAAVGDEANAEMKNPQGEVVGSVRLEQMATGTLLQASFQGLTPGTHAFHVHAVGSCEPPFDSAGGHLNPDQSAHGYRSERGPHVGDMPNVHVPESGQLEVEVFNARLQLDDTVFDDDGSALLLHQSADDYATDPAGNAGPRVACGVIAR